MFLLIIIVSEHVIMLAKNRICMGPGKPGKSWNFILAFSRTGKFWKKTAGPGKCWKSVKIK